MSTKARKPQSRRTPKVPSHTLALEDDRGITAREHVYHIPLADIDPPQHLVRSAMSDDTLADLEASIKTSGVIQPIIVRRVDDRYTIVAGFRRYTAARNLHLATIPAIVRDLADIDADMQTFEENAAREDLNPYDEAVQLAALKERHQLTNQDLARRLNRSEAYVSQRLAILQYPPPLLEALKKGAISFSVARELGHIQNPDALAYYTHYAIRDGVTPALATQWRIQANTEQPAPANPTESSPVVQVPVHTSEPSTNCFLCGQISPYSAMISVWIDRDCAHAFLAEMDTIRAQEKTGEGPPA